MDTQQLSKVRRKHFLFEIILFIELFFIDFYLFLLFNLFLFSLLSLIILCSAVDS